MFCLLHLCFYLANFASSIKRTCVRYELGHGLTVEDSHCASPQVFLCFSEQTPSRGGEAVNGCCGLQAITLWAQSSGNADACVEEIVAGEERRLAAVLGSQGMRFWVCLAACGATWGLAARRGRAEDSSSSSVDASKFPWRGGEMPCLLRVGLFRPCHVRPTGAPSCDLQPPQLGFSRVPDTQVAFYGSGHWDPTPFSVHSCFFNFQVRKIILLL
ncbi:putative uncharacterized protein CELF2-AS1 isoform X1 [Hylobates moloch]|uniref:putative uncharacterized protein CELF2-AS1 isoform X1 n=1 Tax=Hylobates moloch TaxID=81572 RepID=UPI0026745A26|nr:putative uncharacterized protein CELF2-AS1 isoform X1 [Hylobates moloch]